MDTSTVRAKAVGYLLKGPTLLPEPGNGWVVSGIDPRVRVGIFEEESTPVALAISNLTDRATSVSLLKTASSADIKSYGLLITS